MYRAAAVAFAVVDALDIGRCLLSGGPGRALCLQSMIVSVHAFRGFDARYLDAHRMMTDSWVVTVWCADPVGSL